MLADLYNLGTAEVAGIVSRSDQTPEQHSVAVVVPVGAGVLVVEIFVGMGRRVAAEGRCLLVVRCTVQTSILPVAAGGEVVGDKHCTPGARNRVGSNRMVEGH